MIALLLLAAAALAVGPFSMAGGDLPEGWAPLEFPKIPSHTRYQPVQVDGAWVVEAHSEASASGLRRELAVDLREHPILRWRWKVGNVLERGDVTRKDGDDYPARIYITFRYEPERVGWWKKARYNAARVLSGELPIGAINYIWASHAPVGTVVDNSFAPGFVKMIVVESGPEHLGSWREETRNVLEDYRRAFGEDPPLVNGIAIMTDTDNTGESAVAWYGDISFQPAP